MFQLNPVNTAVIKATRMGSYNQCADHYNDCRAVSCTFRHVYLSIVIVKSEVNEMSVLSNVSCIRFCHVYHMCVTT
jgi:hypothetical protein